MANTTKYTCKACEKTKRKNYTRGIDPSLCPKCLKEHEKNYSRKYKRVMRGSTTTFKKHNSSFWNKQPLGKLTDTEIANRLGVSPTTVMKQRNVRGIGKYSLTVRPNQKKMENYIKKRKKLGYSQAALSGLIGIPQTTIAKIESCKKVLKEVYQAYENGMKKI